MLFAVDASRLYRKKVHSPGSFRDHFPTTPPSALFDLSFWAGTAGTAGTPRSKIGGSGHKREVGKWSLFDPPPCRLSLVHLRQSTVVVLVMMVFVELPGDFWS